jgi:hypothetical protein
VINEINVVTMNMHFHLFQKVVFIISNFFLANVNVCSLDSVCAVYKIMVYYECKNAVKVLWKYSISCLKLELHAFNALYAEMKLFFNCVLIL